MGSCNTYAGAFIYMYIHAIFLLFFAHTLDIIFNISHQNKTFPLSRAQRHSHMHIVRKQVICKICRRTGWLSPVSFWNIHIACLAQVVCFQALYTWDGISFAHLFLNNNSCNHNIWDKDEHEFITFKCFVNYPGNFLI
jgi:hypothetical protein